MANLTTTFSDFPTLIFPILNKNKETVWLSQNVTVKRNELQKITGFTVIARDITLVRQIEIEKLRKERKVRIYNETLKEITLKNHYKTKNLESILSDILRIIAEKVDINRVSYWSYKEDYLECENLYLHNKKIYKKAPKLYKKDYPSYFEAIESETQVVTSDVYKSEETKEFNIKYFPKNEIKSLLDTPIYLNGILSGVLCLESTTKIKQWDNQDINFARSIADYLALALETSQRIEAERNLAYKSELLSCITSITNKLIITQTALYHF